MGAVDACWEHTDRENVLMGIAVGGLLQGNWARCQHGSLKLFDKERLELNCASYSTYGTHIIDIILFSMVNLS